jgi:hypothetical protein
MRNTARPTRDHRTITVDFRDDMTYFKLLKLTDFFGGHGREGLTTEGREVILRRWFGSVCNLPLAIGLWSIASCSASYACPPVLDKFFHALQPHVHWNHCAYFRLLVVVIAFAWGRRHVASLYR